MRRIFALYIFHPNLQGWERYEFKYEVQLLGKNIPDWMRYQYKQKFKVEGKVHHLDAIVKINDVWFNDMWTVANGGGEELVLAERIVK